VAILAHRSSSGSSKFHGSDSAARSFSNSSSECAVFGPQVCQHGKWVTSPKPKSGSSRALRNVAVTADKIWDFNAACKFL
jgi:hypothetical protein